MTYIINKIEAGGFKKIKIRKVCTIANLFPKNGYLYKEYKLKLEDKIIVWYVKRSNSKYRWKGYRTAFKHIFSGTVEEFNKFCYDWYKKNRWRKNVRRNNED